MTCYAVTIGMALLLHVYISSAWMPDVRPDLQINHEIILGRFVGNSSDYLKILAHDDTTILVGGRNSVYNISLNGLHEVSHLHWHSSDADRELCALKGKLETDCHNYLRVYARTDVDKIMLCGTNSYKPRCRYYVMSKSGTTNQQHYELIKDVEAQGMCPYNPSHNSTYIYTDGQLYSATVADFSGSDPLIYRETLRTEQYDLKQLNQPDFVGAIERNDYVMFFFREISMEYMNCGKAIYSRVARVCKRDRGGPYTLSKSWTSFLKARLNCSVPGDYPFYFDEIQAITDIVEGASSGPLIYAIFTTSANAISGSAVCAFNVDNILATFDGRFKAQKDSQSNWLPIQQENVPEPRPGKCVDDSRMLTSTVVNYVKNHPLMESAVNSLYMRPLLTKVNLHHRFTTIAVDRQVEALNGERYDIIYAGTDDGKITKFFNIPSSSTSRRSVNTGSDGFADNELKTVVISERQVLSIGVAVRELIVSQSTKTLVVISDGSIVTIPLYHCTSIYDCQTCLNIHDPNCVWDLQNRKCKNLRGDNDNTNIKQFSTRGFIQSLNSTTKSTATLCSKVAARSGEGVQLILNGVGVGTVGSTASAAAKVEYANGEIGKGVTIDLSAQSAESVQKHKHTHILSDAEDENDNNDEHLLFDPLQAKNIIIDEQKLQFAGKSFYWGFAIVVLALVFIIGLFVGLYTSRRICKATAFHVNHRNQLNAPRPFLTNHNHQQHRNSGKDVNLLMNSNSFMQSCHSAKKPNIDIVDEKDRSHECKNSTENLEKEIPNKTSTLTKVKRTYI